MVKTFEWVQINLENVSKVYSWKWYILFYLKISCISVHSINMSEIFKRNGNLSQKVKPIIMERVSYCSSFILVQKLPKFSNLLKTPRIVSKLS